MSKNKTHVKKRYNPLRNNRKIENVNHIIDNDDVDDFNVVLRLDDDNNPLDIMCKSSNGEVNLRSVIKKVEKKSSYELYESVQLKIIKIIKYLVTFGLEGRKLHNDYIKHIRYLYVGENNILRETTEEKNNYVIFYNWHNF